MSELFDETSAAGIAQAAVEQALAALRRVEAVAKIATDAGAAVSASQAAITDLLAAVGVAHRWTGTVLQLRLPDGSYGAGVDLQGEQGEIGQTPTIIVGSVTSGTQPLVTISPDPNDPLRFLADFVLARGEDGDDGDDGLAGANGWSPILAVAVDGARNVLMVTDWTGGTGAKPAAGQYVGPAGLVAAIADASNVRGAPGTGSGDFSGPAASGDGELILFGGTTGKLAKRSNVTPTAFGLARIADADGAAARTGLGLGSAATLAAGTGAGNVVVLDGTSKILASLLPALAISDTFVVASQVAMLALTAERGDVAVRTDLNKSFILKADGAATLANWQELLTPTDAVLAVAGLTGNITVAQLVQALALVVGTNVQAWDADLDAIAALGTTAYGRALLTLTGAGALTALLNPFVADNGSAAGTKGLVPASAAGDAAAGKMLRADGTWAVPATNAAELTFVGQDVRALSLAVAELKGDRLNMIDGVADPFNDASDMAVATTGIYDGTNKLYAGLGNVQTGAYAISSGDTNGAASNAFDGSTSTTWGSSQVTSGVSGVAYIGQDFGSGISRTITQMTLQQTTANNAYVITSVLSQYADAPAGPWTTAATHSVAAGVNTLTIPAAAGAHRCWRLLANSSPTQWWIVTELTMTAAGQNYVLQSVPFTSDVVSPTTARLVVQVSGASGAFTQNTDLIASVSRDGGTTFTAGTLAYVETLADGTKLYETGAFSIAGQPSGSSLVAKFAVLNGKDVRISGYVLQWRP